MFRFGASDMLFAYLLVPALVALGVHLFDNLGLEDLAETANDLNQWEFMFMAAPHVVPNGAG